MDLQQVAPRSLEFSDPVKAPMSSIRMVSIKPQTSNSVSNATESDSIQFKLPSAGMLNCSTMYVKYDLNVTLVNPTSGAGETAVGAVLDEFAPDSSIFSRQKVFSSDGTQVVDINNYGTYCSVMNRLTKDRDERSSRGSIINGCGMATDEALDKATVLSEQFNYSHATYANDGSTDLAVNALAPRKLEGSARNQRILTQQGSVAGTTHTYCHKLQGGILSAEEGHMLPCFAMGSGWGLHLDLKNPAEAFKLVGANALNVLGGIATVSADATCSYTVSNISLECSLSYYDASVFSKINELLCDGIKIRHSRIKTQTNSVSSTSNNVQLSEHGRSIEKLICGLRNTTNTADADKFSNDFLYKPDGTNYIVNFQASVGSNVVPSLPVKYGAQSFLELEKCVAGKNEKNQIGNCMNHDSYFKDNDKGNAVSGDALFGLSFMSHPDAENRKLMSGVSSSSGSIPLSIQCDFNSGPSSTELFTIVESSQVSELLHDGSVIVSR